MTAEAFAMDAITRHQIYLQRYASHEVKQLLTILDDLNKEVSIRVASDTLTEFQAMRLSALQIEIRGLIVAAIDKLKDQLELDLSDLAGYEAEFASKLLNSMVTVSTTSITTDQAMSAVTSARMALISGKKVSFVTIEEAIRQFAQTAIKEVNTIIQSGIIAGEATDEIARGIRGIIENRTKAQAEALVRTATNHAASTARKELYKANQDIMDGEVYRATLDSRTTVECASLDGNFYPVGEGPQPPIHWNCRSTRIPRVNPEYTVRGLKGERSSVDGPVSNKTTYNSWLKKQPMAFKEEVLGVDRAKLFASGGLSLDKFTDDSGKVYDLQTLKAMEPQAFEKAGVVV